MTSKAGVVVRRKKKKCDGWKPVALIALGALGVIGYIKFLE
jgi:hypothetical protein